MLMNEFVRTCFLEKFIMQQSLLVLSFQGRLRFIFLQFFLRRLKHRWCFYKGK